MKTVFSGIQPTGNLHLGNYLGSISGWINLQNQHRCIFGIMNLHAITLPQNPKELQQNVIDCAIVYLAAGLDPEKSIIFVQSDVPEHTELAWILGCLTPLGWLNRMTQFKEKRKIKDSGIEALEKEIEEERESRKIDWTTVDMIHASTRQNHLQYHELREINSANLGLFAYPALMAADILLYKTDLVPVGEDQKQHLELTRDIAGAFNRQYKNEFFKLPEPMIGKETKRIMSLQDGTKKMSKSDESDLSRINLSDDADLIRKKIKKAKTDSKADISYEESRPEIYNLLNIFSSVTGKSPNEIVGEYQNSGFGKFKEELAEAVVTRLSPIQQNITQLKNNPDHVKKILKEGAERAREIAAANMAEIKKITGITI